MQYHYSEHSRKTAEARLRSHEQTHNARAQDDSVSYDGVVLLGAHAIAASTSLHQMRSHVVQLIAVLDNLAAQLDEDIDFIEADEDEDAEVEPESE